MKGSRRGRQPVLQGGFGRHLPIHVAALRIARMKLFGLFGASVRLRDRNAKVSGYQSCAKNIAPKAPFLPLGYGQQRLRQRARFVQRSELRGNVQISRNPTQSMPCTGQLIALRRGLCQPVAP